MWRFLKLAFRGRKAGLLVRDLDFGLYYGPESSFDDDLARLKEFVLKHDLNSDEFLMLELMRRRMPNWEELMARGDWPEGDSERAKAPIEINFDNVRRLPISILGNYGFKDYFSFNGVCRFEVVDGRYGRTPK